MKGYRVHFSAIGKRAKMVKLLIIKAFSLFINLCRLFITYVNYEKNYYYGQLFEENYLSILEKIGRLISCKKVTEE